MTACTTKRRAAGPTELKTAKSRRTLALPARVAEALRRHRAAQAAERLAAGPYWAGSGLVFTTPIGTAIDPNNFRRHLARVSSKAGLGAWTTHELRHSAGSLLFAMGVPMKVISETLGHSSERVTSEMYVHVQAEHCKVAADAMTRSLGVAAPRAGPGRRPPREPRTAVQTMVPELEVHPCGRRQKLTGAQWWPPSKVMIMAVVALDDCTMPTPWAGLVKPR